MSWLDKMQLTCDKVSALGSKKTFGWLQGTFFVVGNVPRGETHEYASKKLTRKVPNFFYKKLPRESECVCEREAKVVWIFPRPACTYTRKNVYDPSQMSAEMNLANFTSHKEAIFRGTHQGIYHHDGRNILFFPRTTSKSGWKDCSRQREILMPPLAFWWITCELWINASRPLMRAAHFCFLPRKPAATESAFVEVAPKAALVKSAPRKQVNAL
jgi:hypothetical protein